MVAGDSPAAAWKAELLSAAGAEVEVYASEPSEELLALAADPPRGTIFVHRRLPQALQVIRIGRAGVDHRKPGAGVTHQVAVGAGAGHYTGVGGGQTQHISEDGHRCVGLPVSGGGNWARFGMEDLRESGHAGHFAAKSQALPASVCGAVGG